MKKVYLAFLWHQHQPMYKNPLDNIYELPWVRLHATKDYYDMVAILDNYPKVKLNINLVPSLLVQLDEYSKGIAKDKFLDLTLKPATHLSESDKIFILKNFFMANWETMIYPYNRYTQLLEKRGKQASETDIRGILKYFEVEDFRDLQVWFNLSWFDPYWRNHDEFINSLYIKGRDFTEEEKQKLIDKQLSICGMIVAKHKELQDRGQIEVSITPFYHPIMPLLCDTNNALDATPNISLPEKRFSHKEDALWHVQAAINYYEKLFEKKPTGMWPSEGSVCDEVVKIVSDNGIKWIATDEAILSGSYKKACENRKCLFRPYNVNVEGKQVNMIFRDHGLSDAIGFVYSKWNADDAVRNFITNVKNIGNFAKDEYETPLVSVILDGENCWEYYKNDGWDFLSKLYETLNNDEEIETVTLTDYLNKFPPKDTLTHIMAGSWINGNFGIWIGHNEDNTSWTYVGQTRDFIVDYTKQHPEFIGSDLEKKVWQILYAAQGSDWNWWYGDDHSSENDIMFDFLFRRHLIAIYALLEQPVPNYLYTAIKGQQKKVSVEKPNFTTPTAFISPIIDGEVSNLLEWEKSGCYIVGHSGGSMHQVSSTIKSFNYGFDLNNIYLALNLNIEKNSNELEKYNFNINFVSPIKCSVCAKFDIWCNVREFFVYYNDTNEKNSLSLENIKMKSIIELKIPINILKLPKNYENIEFTVSANRDNMEVEKWPYNSVAVIQNPTKKS